MATLRVNGFELVDRQLNRLGAGMIRQIVEAGAGAAEKRRAASTTEAGHGPPGKSGRGTGEMLASIGRNEYREFLNGGSVDRLIAGRKIRVMDHPRFSLVVHRRTRTADLSLNGKFFKRYYLDADVTGAVGAYEVPERTRQLWKERGIPLRPADRAELEELLPRGASVLIAEL